MKDIRVLVITLLLVSAISQFDVPVEPLPIRAKTASNPYYSIATTVYNAQGEGRLGSFCQRCKSLKYMAFRVGNKYLSAYPNNLRLDEMSEPGDAQLFEGIQNVDGSWAFKCKNENKYIRADEDGTTINYQTGIGPWERWWIERRRPKHVHIQSAQFANFYWVFKDSVLRQTQGAAHVVIQFWPDLAWGWNW